MLAHPHLASLFALAQVSQKGAESLLTDCSWPITAVAKPAGNAGTVVGFPQRILRAESSMSVQSVELVLFVLVWSLAFSKIRGLVFLLKDRPWFEKAVVRTQESMKKSMGVEVDLAEAARAYANSVAIATQHVTSSLLCLPAVFGALPPEVSSALTRHAALSEVAWEIMDVCEKAHQRWIKPGGARGREEVPNSLIVILACHHTMAMTMVLPVNFFYSDARGYAALVFSLQFAAGVSLVISAYVFSLDAKQPSQLVQMQTMAVSQVLLTVSLRGALFAAAAFDLIRLFGRDGATVFLMLSAPAVLGMSFLNYIIIYDSWCRMRKFLRLAPEVQLAEGGAAAAPGPLPLGQGRQRRLSVASAAAVELSGWPVVGWLGRRRPSAADANAAAAATAHAAAERRRRLSGADANAAAAAAAVAAQAAAEAVKGVAAGEASPHTPDTDVGTSSGTFGDMEGEDSSDFSDFGASSAEEE
mmetsp:Transcript_7051/g.22612  ORF Transcript_7051/g.22612 Transcript_7051/m.22612 type:complete len:472 (-) Transcript_7051:425-1840(-)